MHRGSFPGALAAGGWLWLSAISSGAALADDYVEFDFARAAECRDVTPLERINQYPNQRLIEFSLPISVRFHNVRLDDVDELAFEINGASAGLRVYDFAPATQLTSDVAREIETTTTKKNAHALDATLGGALPVPFAAKVANVTPSISAGTSGGETTTEKLHRLPPKYAVVVSGTEAEGRGVFFKLKRFSQTSLEGVHELAVTFVAPAGWRGGDVQVACSAGGQRKVLFMKQDAMLGREGDMVRLYLIGGPTVRRVAKPVIAGVSPSWRPTRGPVTTATEVAAMVKAAVPESTNQDAAGDGSVAE